MQKFCEQCGSVLQPGDKFCVSCGAPVPEVNNSQPAQNVTNPRQNSQRPSGNKNTKIFIPIVLGVALVGLGIWAGMNYFQTENEVVTESTNPPQNVSANPTPTNNPEPVVNTAAPPLGIEWIQDINTGIYLKNPEPTDGESITWSGGYVQEGQYKFADGYGVTNWYRYGELKQVDEGTFIKGERNGRFQHKFYPSGNVDYSNWDHGVEIVNQANQAGADEVFVGNYNDGTPVYYLINSLSGDPRNAFCTVRAGQDRLDYHFFYKNNILYYKNSEGYEGGVYGGQSPVAEKIWECINKYR